MKRQKEESYMLIQSIEKALSQHNYKRLLSFLELQEGWDGQGACELSFDSLKNMVVFIMDNSQNLPSDLGIFMDSEGSLILNWLVDEHLNELTFSPGLILLSYGDKEFSVVVIDYYARAFNFKNPDVHIGDHYELLSIIADNRDILGVKMTKNLADLAYYDYGWGDYGDEESLNKATLETLILFMKAIGDIESYNKLTLGLTSKGNLELMYHNGIRYLDCFEIYPDKIDFFDACKSYEMTTIERKDFDCVFGHRMLESVIFHGIK